MAIMTGQQEIFLKPIIFDSSVVDFSAFNLPSKVLDPSGNLMLYIDPSKYSPVTINQSSDFIPTGGPSFLNISLVRKGFRVTVDYEETIIRQAVHLLAKYALQERSFLTVKDFVGPEAGDISTEIITLGSSLPRTRVTEEASFTTRLGIIQAPIEYGGSIGDATPGGFTFSFIEKDLRFI